MRAIPQLVSAPLNPINAITHFISPTYMKGVVS